MQKVYYQYKTRAISVTLILALLFAFGGCSSSGSNPSPTPDQKTVNEDEIICKVNDAVITRGDFEAIFNVYYQYYSQYIDMTNADTLKSLQDEIFNSLVQSEVIYQQAIKSGISLTAKEEEEIINTVQYEYVQLLEQFEELAASEGAQDVGARAVELFAERLKIQGLTIEEYKAKTTDEKRKSAMLDALYTQITKGITYTETDARAEFATELQEQMKEFTEDPAKYETALESYQNSGGIPPLFIPEGYIRVKHILVDTEEKANEMIRLLDEGADFDELMAEHGTDPGMKSEPNMSQGYLMGPGTPFDPEFKEAGFALKNVGDYSGVVKSSYDYGYHVIKLVQIVESRETSFTAIRDTYLNTKLNALKDELFASEVEKWRNEADITSYIGRIRDLGKAS